MVQAVAYYEAALKQGGQQFLRLDSSRLLSCILMSYAVVAI